MADAAKPDIPVTASPPASPLTAVTARFPSGEDAAGVEHIATDRSDVVYRPLSSAAIAGFSLAALYAAVVLIGALVAALERKPWLMGSWSILLPVVAIGLCLAGWFIVQTSEGTRTGRSLAVWGITISIVATIGYWAYYGATYFVISSDAERFCQEWFDKIREEKIESAYLMTLQPRHRPHDDANVRDAIEMRFNPETGQGKPGSGGFSIFKQHLLTHAIRHAGPNANIIRLGVTGWEYSSGGYLVRQRYRVETPEYSYEAIVSVRSNEGQSKAVRGRQWNVVLQETTNDRSLFKPTPEGQKILMLQGHAAQFLSEWENKLRSPVMLDTVNCYLGTLDPESRVALVDQLKKSLPLSASTIVGDTTGGGWNGLVTACCGPLAIEKQLPGFHDYLRGDLVQLGEKFWLPPKVDASQPDAPMVLAEARKLFHGFTDMPMGVLKSDPDRLAFWKIENGRVQIRHTVQIHLRSLPQSLEGEAVMDCDTKMLDTVPRPSDCWKIERINLTVLRAMPQGPPGTQGRQPGQGGPGGGMFPAPQ
jgi:hypothetical protein